MSKRLPVRKPVVSLGSKDDTQFSEALKLYDSKQYKKSLKILDTVLKKNSQHAPSLALKGLVLNYCDVSDITSMTTSKSEAESYILKALSKDDSNHIVNHIAGIYYRALKNYKEACKWYNASIENKSPNKSILRDLSSMQAQIGDFTKLPISRLAYLEDQPGYRANWTGAAVAHHLNGDYQAAEKVLTRIEELVEDKLQPSDLTEHYELLLYKVKIIGDSGDFKRAIELINQLLESKKYYDGLGLLELKAHYLIQLNELKSASLVYRELLKRNPDNVEYYYKLEKTLGISNSNSEIRLKLYEKLNKFYPKSDPPKFIPLTFLKGEEFEIHAQEYIISQLSRGVPSTFVNVKPLYKNKENIKTIFNIVDEFFYGDAKENPLTTAWTAYFLTQHYYHIKDYEYALKMCDFTINHTPTLIEPYIMKARILKRQNQLIEAAEIMEYARKLDLQDRFINSKTTKYYLRANEINKAIDTISIFTKNDDSPNGLKDLHTMQSIWFLIESGEAYFRLYKLANAKLEKHISEDVDDDDGLSYKRFKSVCSIFDEFHDDQLDFHQYCMRKATPRAYMTMISWGQNLYDQGLYIRSISGMTNLTMSVVSNTKIFKKEVKSITKKSKKDKKEERERRDLLISYSAGSTNETDDIFAELYLQKLTSSKIKDVEKLESLVKLINKMDSNSVITQILNFKLNYYLKKYVICYQSLKNLNSIQPKNSNIGWMFLKLYKVAKSEDELEPIKKILIVSLTKTFPELMDDKADIIDILLSTYFTKDDFETGRSIIECDDDDDDNIKLIERLEIIQNKLDPYRSNYLNYYK
ncbi:hypothetical protein CANARDRAFT_204850 [[Candida] arabinofermentans NRRL YB-2248]|uniref:N-terminal acetyltransferase A, auxiliary subunit n=1 Tax=[Candida] arabinofermentans NRRL YB-2248 TaxID=983967 RepID=A0A1E4SSZ0_9ASCO|nr:hypothetical protein CANARDRAFT_204850 [[Candida] arabinofermentans NRRL YB-2248]